MKRCLLGFFTLCFSVAANAVLNIEITDGMEDSIPIAVVPFQWSGGSQPGDTDVSAIIASDLARSGKFAPLPEKDLVAKPRKPEDVHFKTWRVAGIDHLIIGGVQHAGSDDYKVEFRLFDILKGEQVLGYSFSATSNSLRSVAHRISDFIIQNLTGLSGAFDARIAYVTTRQLANKKIKYYLQVADTDGFNPQTLLTSDEPIMSPVWSPDGSKMAYVSFEKDRAEIYIHDIHTAKRQLITSFKGINGAPVWSPDGRKLAITLSKDGNPDIYILSIQDKSLLRVTKHWAIDTEAAWMPDGESLIFTSSRSGSPQLYRVFPGQDLRPQRLTFEGKYNANPSVSKDGNMIAFVNGENNIFRIAIMDIENQYVQLITDGPLDESPEFAPNGSMVLYASQYKGRSVLAAVSTDGRHKQRLALSEGQVREPAWSAARK